MQPITISQINRRHPGSLPPIIALIIRRDGLLPKLAHLLGTILTETDVDEEIRVRIVGLEVRGGVFGCPCFDGAGDVADAVPAAQFDGAGGFVVHRCAEGDYALDLWTEEEEDERLGQGGWGQGEEAVRTLSGASNAIRTVIHPP